MKKAAKRVLTARDFRRWHEHALPGDRVIYHVGDLAFDRRGNSDHARNIDELGASAYDFARTNELHLLQKRLDISVWEYIGVRTNPRDKAKFDRWCKRPLSASEVQPIRKSPPTPQWELV